MILQIVGYTVAFLIVLFLAVTLNIKFNDGEAKADSWHVWLYKRLWCFDDNYNLPPNICTYFWRYLLGIIQLPLTIIPVLISVVSRKFRDFIDGGLVGLAGFLFTLIAILIFLVGPGVYSDILKLDTLSELTLFQYMIGVVGAVLFIGVVPSILFIIFSIKERLERGRLRKPKTESVLVTRFKDWKSNSCTIINWK